MLKVATKDFKNQVSKFLRQVEEGEEIIITRNGHSVARILPETEESAVERNRQVFQKLMELGDKIRAEGRGMTWEEIKAMRDEGRR